MNFVEGSWLSTIPPPLLAALLRAVVGERSSQHLCKQSIQAIWWIVGLQHWSVCLSKSFKMYVISQYHIISMSTSYDLLPSLSKCPVHCGIKLLSMIIQLSLWGLCSPCFHTHILVETYSIFPPIFEAKKGNNRLGGPNYPHRKKLHLTRHWLEQSCNKNSCNAKNSHKKTRQAKRNFRGRTLRTSNQLSLGGL